MEKIKNSKGITLISLVITVIVLLILAAIALSVLTGENSVLKRGAEARTTTSTEQIKERIRLAYTAAITTGDGAITEELLRQELTKEFGENGYELKDNEEDATKWEVKVKTTVEVIKKPANLAGGNGGSLTLSVTEYETESRAVVLEVTVPSVSPTETDLQSKREEELKSMFLVACQILGAQFTSWNDISQGNDEMTVEDAFTSFSFLASQGYTSAYDFIIKTGAYVEPTTFTLGEETIVGTKAEFIIAKNGSYTVTASNEAGDTGVITANVTKCVNRKDNLPEKFSAIQTTNKTWEVEEGYSVTVPAGFAYGTSANVGKVTTGFVITDAVDSSGNSIGNEFVWIPVVEDGGIIKVGSSSGQQFAEKISENSTNYRGVFYNFGRWSNDQWTAYSEPQKITYFSTGYREPAYLTDTLSADGSSYNLENGNPIVTEQNLQKEYDDMIKSVKENGGFYVSRYEMQKSTNNKAETKIGKMPISAAENEANMWYGLYKLAKTYQNSQDSVVSSMIWGSQYDAMLNFSILTENDNEKINETTNGNHTGKKLKTGTHNGTDSILNIFDLEGNFLEWTQEANGTDYRVYRGGFCNFGYAPSDRNNYYPSYNYEDYSSRLTLYVK